MEFARVEEFTAPGCAFNVVQYGRPRALSPLPADIWLVSGVEKEEIRQVWWSRNSQRRRRIAAAQPQATQQTRVAELCGVTGEVSFALRRRA